MTPLRRFAALALCTAWAAAAPVTAQARPAAQQPAAAAEESAAKREWALERIRGLGDKIEALRDERAKVHGLARLAELVCKEEAEYAQTLFLKAFEIGRNVKPPPQPSVGRGMMGFTTRETPAETVLRQIAGCDAELAFRLREEKQREDEQSPLGPISDLRVAWGIMRDQPDKAAQFAMRAASASVDLDTIQSLVPVLMQLVTTSRAEADAIFAHVVRALAAEPRADSWRLLLMGNFLFGPPSASGTASPDSSRWMIFFGLPMVNIQAPRPWTTPEQARFYLETSLDILSRPVSDSAMNRQDYAAAYQMHILAQRFAPDLAPMFAGLMERLVAQGLVAETAPAEAEGLARPMSFDSARLASDFDETRDPIRRQAMLINALPAMFRRGEFDRAREAAAELAIAESRDAVLAIADFLEAAKALTDGDVDPAKHFSEELKDHTMRALLRAGAGAELARQGSRAEAVRDLLWAQREAGFTEPRLRSALLTAVSGAMAEIDPSLAVMALQQAVAAYNEVDREGKPASLASYGPRIPPDRRAPTNPYTTGGPFGFSQIVHISLGQQSFQLPVRGVSDYMLSSALLKQFGAEAERAEAAVSELVAESRKALALANVAAAYLEAIPKTEAEKSEAK